jgi:hypothetical protein
VSRFRAITTITFGYGNILSKTIIRVRFRANVWVARISRTVWSALAAVLILALAGCTGDEGVDCDVQQDTQGQKVICNGSQFSYTLQGSRSAMTDQYSWQNPGEKAYVSAVFQGVGTVYVTIKDHNGIQVYSKAHNGAGQTVGSQATSPGDAGTWAIKIETKDLQGQVVVTVGRNPG